MGRRLRTTLDWLHPDYCHSPPPGACLPARGFSVGDPVYALNFDDVLCWLLGHIAQLTGPYSYRVQLLDGRVWRHHINQLRCRITDMLLARPDYQPSSPPDGSSAQPDASFSPPAESSSTAILPSVLGPAGDLAPPPSPPSASLPGPRSPERSVVVGTTPTGTKMLWASSSCPVYLEDYACGVWGGEGCYVPTGMLADASMPVLPGCYQPVRID